MYFKRTNLEKAIAYLERLQRQHITPEELAERERFVDEHYIGIATRLGLDEESARKGLAHLKNTNRNNFSRYEFSPWIAIVSDIFTDIKKILKQAEPNPKEILFGTLATGDVNGQVLDYGNSEYLLVMIDDATLTFANLLGKAIAHNIPLKETGEGELNIDRDTQAIETWINRDLRSHERFVELFLHYAIDGDPQKAPRYDPSPEYDELSTVWRKSIEYFIIGHEYGHAHLGHLGGGKNRRIGHRDYSEIAFDWDKELQADQFGLDITLKALKTEKVSASVIYAGIEMFFDGQEFAGRTIARFLGMEYEDKGTNSHPPIYIRLDNLRLSLSDHLTENECSDAIELASRVKGVFCTLWPEMKRHIDYNKKNQNLALHKKWQPKLSIISRIKSWAGSLIWRLAAVG
jgi:hypothetical protein